MLSLTNISVSTHAPKGTTVGVLALWNPSVVSMNANFILSPSSAGFFAVSGYNLVTLATGIKPGFYAVEVTGNGTNTAWEEEGDFIIEVTAT